MQAWRAQAKHGHHLHGVWNLAAPLSVDTAKDPAKAHDVTVGGMRRLLEACNEYGVKNVYAHLLARAGPRTPARPRCSRRTAAARANVFDDVFARRRNNVLRLPRCSLLGTFQTASAASVHPPRAPTLPP